MKRLADFILGLLVLGGFLWLVGWLAYRALERSEDRGRLIAKWIISGLLIGFTVKVLVPVALESPLAGVPFLAVIGVIVGVIWAPSIATLLAKSVTNSIDGGLVEPEARPFYSVAEAKRKRGQYREAIAEVEKELARFPTDFLGHVLLAEIQAEDLKDLPAARNTLERLLAQEDHAPKNRAYALNRLADWELKMAADPEAARAALERILQAYPDTESAYLASQRLAHTESIQPIEAQKNPLPMALKRYEEKLGLREDFAGLKAVPEDWVAKADSYVKRLEQCPTDDEVREALALLYAEHFQRLDLAVDQLEQLLAQPGAPARQVTRWLNLLADLQIKNTGDLAAARQALQRIIDRFPQSAQAEKARNRLGLLGLELKGQQPRHVLSLGAYEQNLGLKQGWPKRPGG